MFTVTANDAHGGLTPETVTVPISSSTITVGGGIKPFDVAVSPNGTHVYVTDANTFSGAANRCR